MRLFRLPLAVLPSVSPSNRDKLPPRSGVYYCMRFGTVFYVGRAVNLRNRWVDHHKLNKLHGLGWKIAYRECPRRLVEGREWEDINRYAEKGFKYPPFNEVHGYHPPWWWMIQTIDFILDSVAFSILSVAAIVLIQVLF